MPAAVPDLVHRPLVMDRGHGSGGGLKGADPHITGVMTLPFLKMHGLGNDFVVIDARNRPLALFDSVYELHAGDFRHGSLGFIWRLLEIFFCPANKTPEWRVRGLTWDEFSIVR